MTRALEGHRIVVTGSSEGIGRAIALCLAEEGARVVVNASGQGEGGRDAAVERLEGLVSELAAAGGEGAPSVASVADPEGAEAIVQTAVDAFGGLDGLVNCAGIPGRPANSIREIALDDWSRVVSVHLDGTFLCSRAAIPHLRDSGGGVIVNTSSHGFLGMYGGSAYPAAKGGINSLTWCMATDLAEFGIRCNAVCPGAKTRLSTGPDYEEMIRGLEARGILSDGLAEISLNSPPPEECAPIYAYLLSDAAREVNGRIFTASGPYVGLFPIVAEQMVGAREPGDGPWTVDALSSAVDRALAEERS